MRERQRLPLSPAPSDARQQFLRRERAGTLPVVETFHSLQGEGLHSGRSAFFIRVAGCRVGCSWCDTKHSWTMAAHPQRHLQSLIDEAARAEGRGAGFVVITGGEPLHHDLWPLTEGLRQQTGLPLHLETSGVDPLSGQFDWVTLSPKSEKPPRNDLLISCQELKVVVHTRDDLCFAEAMAQKAEALRQPDGTACPALLLQPGSQSSGGTSLALEYVRSHPRWRLSLQLNKTLGLP